VDLSASKGGANERVRHLGIENQGNLDCQRNRLNQYMNQNPEYTYPAKTESKYPELMETKEISDQTLIDIAKIMNQIRKWSCHFDGKDPFAFLEQIEELRQGYRYSGELLLGLSELLRGDTLLWYYNNKAF